MNLIVIKTDKDDFKLDADAFMQCQREYDINQKHIETGLFWDFFNEHFQDALSGRRAYSVDKLNSPGYAYLQEKQREWRQEREQKRRELRAWRDELNKKNLFSKRMRFFRAV